MNQNTKRLIAFMIALIMAAPVFVGITDVSYAASVSGAKATNYGFRMVRISWSAVKVENQQEPVGPDEPAEPPVAPAAQDGGADDIAAQDDEGEMPATDSVEPLVDSSEPAADPADPNTDPADPAVSQITDPVESDDSNRDSNMDPAFVSGADQATDSGTASASVLSSDPEEQTSGAVDTIAGPIAEPEALSAESAAPGEPQVQLASQSEYDAITYKVYRATSKNGKYALIKTTNATSFINKGLTIGKTYYYKVIACKSNGEKYGTSAIVSIKVAQQVTANMTLLTKENATFNYRISAKQKLHQYDTLQGACASGGYAYLTLYNGKVEKCRIVKVRLSDLSIVKVSKTLPIYHGNNLTYDTKKNRIVATCCTTIEKAKYRVVLIHPKTLKVISTKNAKLTKKVKNLPKKVRTKNIGYSAIAYNEKHNCYVARMRDDGNVVILSKNLVPLRYVVLKGKKTGLLEQGIETDGNYIYDVRSFEGKYNYCMVTVHTMAGKYVGQIKFPNTTPPKKELECIFHDGKQFYAGFFYSTIRMNYTKQYHSTRVNLIQRLNNL